MKIGVVGCGAISDIYLQNMTSRFPELEVAACCAGHLSNAQKKAEKYGLRACTLDELLSDAAIELVVNLTPPQAHADIIRQALLAGKHVYTEKVLAVRAREAEELVDLAHKRGLYLGSAPDTFLGDALQTARSALDAGLIGEVTGCHASLNRGMGHFYEFLAFTRQPGGGMGFDTGPYYLSALLYLLGPVAEVSGMTATSRPERINRREGHPDFGKPYIVENENVFTALLRFRSGILGTVNLNGDCVFPEQPHFVIYGTKGILFLPNPDEFGGEVRILHGAPCGSGIVNYEILKGSGLFSGNSRGLGVAEMVHAINAGRENLASASMAAHAVEIAESVVRSGETGSVQSLRTTFERPALLGGYQEWMGTIPE